MTPAERHFREFARRKRWTVLRPGWPDFLCIDNDGQLRAVEVKQGRDLPSERQFRTLDLLNERSDIDVFVWIRETPKTLWAWEQARSVYGSSRRTR